MTEDKKNAEYIKLMNQMIKELKYGSITLTVQDGKIVQMFISNRLEFMPARQQA